MNDGEICGERVILRPATPGDKRRVYEWFAHSDVTPAMVGPPTYPERSPESWEEFDEGYAPHYFDGPETEIGRCYLILADGEPVGQVSYNDIVEGDGPRRVELDIWMRSEADCGRGFGADALSTLCRHLAGRFGVRAFMVQPSARNPRAIRAYEQAGFARLGLTLDEAKALWGPNDYGDSVYMVKRIEPGGSGARPPS